MKISLDVKKHNGNCYLEVDGVISQELKVHGGLFATAGIKKQIFYCPFCGKKL